VDLRGLAGRFELPAHVSRVHGRAGTRGKHKIVVVLSGTGGQRITALTAFRRRQELARHDAAPAQTDDLGCPVTMAVAGAAQLREGIRADVQSLWTR
jgi:hypothetical protein